MNAVTVSQVNTYIRSLLEGEQILTNIYVTGEISNCVYYRRSGHIYMTLKDEKSQLKAVMFSAYASRLKFALNDGMKVICRGRISCYEKDGIYQLIVEDVQPDGIGALNLAFEQLKERLSKEGLFDESVKKPIPQFPNKIGVVTSNSGAAVEDVKNITRRRYPLCEIIISPTIVQGEKAPADIIRSIKRLDGIDDIDTIIIARGGGSVEDLWAFNDEGVARAVYACKKPVISAVGHETDFTICDFVADLRAPTPSAAAELAVPDMSILNRNTDAFESSLRMSLMRKLDYEIMRFDRIINSVLFDSVGYFTSKYDYIAQLKSTLDNSYTAKIKASCEKLSEVSNRINDMSPMNILCRGFCSMQSPDGRIVKSVKELTADERVIITLSDGSAECTVNEVIYGKNDI